MTPECARPVRRSVICLALALSLLAAAIGASATQTMPVLDRVIDQDLFPAAIGILPGDKLVWSRLRIISLVMRVPVGIEEAPEPFVDNGARSAGNFQGMTVRAALDLLIAEDPRYAWREMNGVIVVRPVSSWNDCSHPFNRHVSGTNDDFTMLSAISWLYSLLNPASGMIGGPVQRNQGATFRLAVPDGSVLDAFDEIARTQGMSWQISGASRLRASGTPVSLTLIRLSDRSGTGTSVDFEPRPASCTVGGNALETPPAPVPPA